MTSHYDAINNNNAQLVLDQWRLSGSFKKGNDFHTAFFRYLRIKITVQFYYRVFPLNFDVLNCWEFMFFFCANQPKETKNEKKSLNINYTQTLRIRTTLGPLGPTEKVKMRRKIG